MHVYKLFTRSLAWNTLEAVFYQGLLLAHQLFLFQSVDRSMYGLIGSLFSLTYLIVTLINFGFDVSLAPFFKIACTSRQSFRKIFMIQLIPEYLLIVTFFGLFVLGFHYISPEWTIRYQLTLSLATGLMLLALLESAKKTFRAILHLSFLNHKTAFVEVATIMSYIGLVWGYHFLGHPFSLGLIFMPMIITSGISCMVLGWHTKQLYNKLPNVPLEKPHALLQVRILKNRFFNFLNQISHVLFSSNFLVPFFAMQFGLQQAGILKLVSTIVYCITVILQKVFGISSASMLAHIKEESMDNKRTAFSLMSNHLNQALFMITIFFILNFNTLINWSAHISNQQTWYLLYLFFIISFSENFFIAYEKFYIAEEKTSYLFVFNALVMCAMGCIFYYADHIQPLTLLVAVIGIRLLSFIGLSILSFYHWQLRSSYTMNPWLTAGSIVFSSLFFILT